MWLRYTFGEGPVGAQSGGGGGRHYGTDIHGRVFLVGPRPLR